MPRGVPNRLTETPERAMCLCGQSFVKRRDDQEFCSAPCRLTAYVVKRSSPDFRRFVNLEPKT